MNPDKLNPTAIPAPPALAEDDDREPTKEELLEDLRVALRDVLAGYEGIPARDGIEAIRRKIYGDADHS
ncbi:MAG: hypothetical protein OXN94_10345 [Chloroflexota bacterium]|nr:hypothetical protein [Chloroflexota bacterium]MDE2858234.1 hypothetical protein [Chloroflexota bacterium]MDE2952393.1 hypothetical protein [Chloroflexota bacterium]